MEERKPQTIGAIFFKSSFKAHAHKASPNNSLLYRLPLFLRQGRKLAALYIFVFFVFFGADIFCFLLYCQARRFWIAQPKASKSPTKLLRRMAKELKAKTAFFNHEKHEKHEKTQIAQKRTGTLILYWAQSLCGHNGLMLPLRKSRKNNFFFKCGCPGTFLVTDLF